jgi:hypothetical protein
MRTKFGFIIFALLFVSCNNRITKTVSKPEDLPITGTWQFILSTTIKHKTNDTSVADFRVNKSGIKIINSTHYAFLLHDLTKGKESPYFVAGGGRCSLEGNKYIENLDYCSGRKYENLKVEFTAMIQNDTLTLRGVEKIDSLEVNQTIIEKYIRLK